MRRAKRSANRTIAQLARFRYQLRRFLRSSEKRARAAGVTPQQYLLLLGAEGHTGRGWATISELAEFLQERHNSVVGLVDRAVRRNLLTKEPTAGDLRAVRVALTPEGRRTLAKLAADNHRELTGMQRRTGLRLIASQQAAQK